MSELSQTNRRPEVGERVRCPEDRGEAAYDATVRHVSAEVQTNIHGVPYVWVSVQKRNGQRHTWPSHRLGFNLRHLVEEPVPVAPKLVRNDNWPHLQPGWNGGKPTAVPSCRLHIDHELDPKYHE